MEEKQTTQGEKKTCSLHMYQAGLGDCFLLEFGTGEDEFRMMIDTGTVDFGKKCLKDVLKNLKKKKKKIDLLVISHIDGDHIGGALALLRVKRYAQLIKEIWHNGLQQTISDLPDKTDKRSMRVIEEIASNLYTEPAQTGGTTAEQSEELDKLAGEWRIIINGITGGKAIMEDLAGKCIGPKGDIEVFVLLPRREHLDALREYFLNELPPGAQADKSVASEKCFTQALLQEDGDEYEEAGCAGEDEEDEDEKSFVAATLKTWADQTEADEDSKVTNASSIALIIRYQGKKLLFPGDAGGQDLSDALQRWLEANPKENLLFDVVKLPHHGSNRNCFKLLDTPGFDGKLFLVSTSGKNHGHPNMETLAKAVVRQEANDRVLAFNYANSAYKIFNFKKNRKTYQYRVTRDSEFPEFEVKENEQ